VVVVVTVVVVVGVEVRVDVGVDVAVVVVSVVVGVVVVSANKNAWQSDPSTSTIKLPPSTYSSTASRMALDLTRITITMLPPS
jgi:hypothetical protein